LPTTLSTSCVGADLVIGIDSLAFHLSLKDVKITEYTFDGGWFHDATQPPPQGGEQNGCGRRLEGYLSCQQRFALTVA
jgi:hypothetical protein